ncbi:hypothetical protein C2E23DRAFT_451457 [Lenzites betulinus]|nr:hypothetical protein C2E23DRAFT_451457 [Lenzites betulinus]
MLFGGSTNGPLNLSPAAFSQSWPETPYPHPKASRLSRFYEGVAVTATDATPVARNILQARCEVTTDSIASPVNASISADNSALAVIGQGGWKNRDPTLVVYLLDIDPDADESDQEDGINSYGDFNNIVIEPGPELGCAPRVWQCLHGK